MLDDNFRGGGQDGRGLRVCGYPSWALNKATDGSKKKKEKTNDRNYRSQVVIPYVEGVSEREYIEY